MNTSQKIRSLAPEMDPLRLGMGWSLEDLEKPQIMVECTFGDSHPGSAHLLGLADAAMAGVAQAGARGARYFATDICDGMAQGHDGINYSLASRDILANLMEIHAGATPFDGAVFLSSCDKSVPARLMAMGRINIPAVMATGGVMEAAVRTVADVLNDKDIQKIDYEAVRGVDGLKTAEVEVTPDLTVKVAVASGGSNIRKVMEGIKNGEYKDYHFIELMACPGGCVNGGGQPIISAKRKMEVDIRAERAKALYSEDASKKYRKSHQNPSVIRIYEEFLGEPGGHKAHELLHTTYSQKAKV